MTFYELCVDILAIAGGSVATIGVINSVYHFLFAGKWNWMICIQTYICKNHCISFNSAIILFGELKYMWGNRE